MTDALDGKRFFVDAYLAQFDAKIARVEEIAAPGFLEEALILACCYLAALAQMRFGGAGSRKDAELFTRLLTRYGGHPDLFARVSRAEIARRSDADPFAPKAFTEHARVAAALATRYGSDVTVAGDPTAEEVRAALANTPGIDTHNLAVNLSRYTYGAILYNRWRNAGVHQGKIGSAWDVDTGRKTYPAGEDGAPVYYDPFGRLTFSAAFVIGVLRTAFQTLRDECVRAASFPHELGA